MLYQCYIYHYAIWQKNCSGTTTVLGAFDLICGPMNLPKIIRKFIIRIILVRFIGPQMWSDAPETDFVPEQRKILLNCVIKYYYFIIHRLITGCMRIIRLSYRKPAFVLEDITFIPIRKLTHITSKVLLIGNYEYNNRIPWKKNFSYFTVLNWSSHNFGTTDLSRFLI